MKFIKWSLLFSFYLILSFNIKANIKTDVKPTYTLPIIYINVYTDETKQQFDNEIIDKDLHHKNYFENAEFWIVIPEGCNYDNVGSESEPLDLSIKGRGNFTLNSFSKKPYKIKLGKKQNLLNLTPAKSKHYCLLPHADDKMGYLKDFLAFNLGKRIGLSWVPNMEPIELIVNNDYRGIYFLVESIRVQEGRVDITELEDNETHLEKITGGYNIELDNYEEDNQIIIKEDYFIPHHHDNHIKFTPQSPEILSDIQRNFLVYQLNQLNHLIGKNSDDLWGLVDLDDLARFYLINEILSNTEAFTGSTYLFRDRGENQKWHISLLWDFGHALDTKAAETFFYETGSFHNVWIPAIRENERFNQKVKETWLWFMSTRFESLEDDVEEYINKLRVAVYNDYDRWHDEPLPEPYINSPGQVADNRNLDSKKKTALQRLYNKIDWLKNMWGDYSSSTYPEPLRDNTQTAKLPFLESLYSKEIKVNLDTIVCYPGDQVQLTATVNPVALPEWICWFSDNETIATINKEGLITALSPGETKITISCGNVYTECIITVMENAGIDSVWNNQDTKISVYSINGILIKKICREDDLKSLAKGVYIIVCEKGIYKITI